MSAIPTLHDIAAMPFPASEQALQRYYGVEPWKERSAAPRKTFEVIVSYSWSERSTATYEVEADTRDEAEAEAEKLFDRDGSLEGEDCEIDDMNVTEMDA